MTYKVSLTEVVLEVTLGVYDFERQDKQKVHVDVTLDFLDLPQGCISDQLEDVICYAKLNACLLKTANEKPYRLIEHLGYRLTEAVFKMLSIPADIRLSLYKKPPLENVKLAGFTLERKWQG